MRTLKGPIGRDGLNDKLLYLAAARRSSPHDALKRKSSGRLSVAPLITLSPPMSEYVGLENIFERYRQFCTPKLDGRRAFQRSLYSSGSLCLGWNSVLSIRYKKSRRLILSISAP